jgi:large subunit ribosomal protein L15
VNISINLQEVQDITEGDSVNLGELGYDKLLGKGKINRPINITVAKASERAVSKVEAAGGSVSIED